MFKKNRLLVREIDDEAWRRVYEFSSGFQIGVVIINKEKIKIVDPYEKLALDGFDVVVEKNKKVRLNTANIVQFPRIINVKQSLIDVAKYLLENSPIEELYVVFLQDKALCVGFYRKKEDQIQITNVGLQQGIRIMFS